MYLFLGLALFMGVVSFGYQLYRQSTTEIALPEGVMCTMDAQLCPDGSYVGRTGPNCKFVCPASSESVPAVPGEHADIIVLDSPQPLQVISTPLTLSGQARGNWYFEASFPVLLKDGNGTVIAQGPATAVSDWMTSEFVPFTMSLAFVNPYTPGDSESMKTGTLILQKDNPSGMPEHDDSLEIPVRFAP